jgi:hypothetical protein
MPERLIGAECGPDVALHQRIRSVAVSLGGTTMWRPLRGCVEAVHATVKGDLSPTDFTKDKIVEPRVHGGGAHNHGPSDAACTARTALHSLMPRAGAMGVPTILPKGF